ncbi:hypothetical protein D3C87_1736960 [compost metagenome]
MQPVHVHLQRHQQAAQFVVHLAGDAGALVFTHLFRISRQLTQLHQRLRKLLGACSHTALQFVVGKGQFVMGPLQFVSSALAAGDVQEGDDGAVHLLALQNGMA